MAAIANAILRVDYGFQSTTAMATPSAMVATQFRAFASTVSGAVLMGYGTTGDVTFKNRAGTSVAYVGPNTTTFHVVANLSQASGTAALQAVTATTVDTTSTITVVQATDAKLILNQSGTRQWTFSAASGNIRITSGDSAGSLVLGGVTLTHAGAASGFTSWTGTGRITTTMAASSQVFVASVTGGADGALYMSIVNSGSSTVVGNERAAGGVLMTGTSGNASVFGNASAFATELGSNGVIRLSISSAGAFDFKSNPLSGITTVGASGLITGGTGRFGAGAAPATAGELTVDTGGMSGTLPLSVEGGTSNAAIAKFFRGGSEKPVYIAAAQNNEGIVACEGDIWLSPNVSANDPFASGSSAFKLTSTTLLTTTSFTSAAPSSGTAGAWKFGIRVAATVALDTTQYIQLDVGGTLYKIGIVT